MTEYDPTAEPFPDRDELLRNLAAARFDRGVNVAAIKLLLEELRRDDDEDSGSSFDDLDGDGPIPIDRARQNRQAS